MIRLFRSPLCQQLHLNKYWNKNSFFTFTFKSYEFYLKNLTRLFEKSNISKGTGFQTCLVQFFNVFIQNNIKLILLYYWLTYGITKILKHKYCNHLGFWFFTLQSLYFKNTYFNLHLKYHKNRKEHKFWLFYLRNWIRTVFRKKSVLKYMLSTGLLCRYYIIIKNRLILINKWNNEFCQLKYRPKYWIWNFCLFPKVYFEEFILLLFSSL